jgi:glycosyltransferase involved in cell wall biosynthesis
MLPGLTIAIISFNEEEMIRDCILSAGFADQIIVVDSGSIDNTQLIAKSLNAEVYIYNQWEGFATQRNRALSHCKHEYVFFLDCDERITPRLAKEIKETIAANNTNYGFIRWENYVFGKKLRGIHETKGIPRLFKTNDILKFSGIVHEKPSLKERIPSRQYFFKSKLIHHSRRNIYQSLLKLAQYTRLSSARLRDRNSNGGVVIGMAHAIPRFLNMYVLKLSFLSGREGFLYCLFVSLETLLKYCAVKYDSEEKSIQLPKR